MATEEDNQHNDVVPIKLPAPSGWSKELTPKKGGTTQRKEIVFISPTGEEIKNKRQLDQYLKSHPGGPAASEFDWSTGDTPRRSTRLSEKSKADIALPSQSPTKRLKKSSAKGAQEKINADAEEEAIDNKDASTVEDKETVEGSTVETNKDIVNKDAEEEAIVNKDSSIVEEKEIVEGSTVETNNAAHEDVIQGKRKSEDEEMRTDARNDTEKLNASVGESNNATTVEPDAKLEETKEASHDETKEASHAGKETEDGKVDISVKEEDERGKSPQQ